MAGCVEAKREQMDTWKRCTGEQTLVGSGEMREEDMGAMRRVRLSRTEHGGRGKSGVRAFLAEIGVHEPRALK